MADPRGFITTGDRELPERRPVSVRIRDYREVFEPSDPTQLRRQAGRCMDCGIPFCHDGCPLGNLIPEWNDLMWRGEGRQAIERLHVTNNFPEFTGRLCPAPCETSCVLSINQPAVTIKQVEVSIIDQAFARGWVEPHPPDRLTGKTVAIVGSGPAGLAAAQQLTRAGHTVAVYERDDRIGGLVRYGIPSFKMDKKHLDGRLSQMMLEGTRFRAGVNIGADIAWNDLRARYDSVVIATGAVVPRDLSIPGRSLSGIHFAMEYLVQQNRELAGDAIVDQLTAADKHVVIIGGGDTGADCLGTAHRQRAASVTTLAIGQKPPLARGDNDPWPTQLTLYEESSAHQEGGERTFLASTVELLPNSFGEVGAVRVAQTEYLNGHRVPRSGTERTIPADLVLLALGFSGPETESVTAQLDVSVDPTGTLERDGDFCTGLPGVFVAGDAGRGQSLIVWAIAEGRSAAAAVDRYLQGETQLSAPIRPTDRAMAI